MSDINSTPFPPAAHRMGESPNWVVGVIDDAAEADHAAADVRAAGFGDKDVVVLHGQEALDLAQAKEDAMNPVKRLLTAWGSISTDPGTADEEYIEAARNGHSLVSVRAEAPEDVQRAREVLLAHDAHDVKHFGEWVNTDLS